LKGALSDQDEDVREAAEEALEEITGQDFSDQSPDK
jgi:HEAT repeat protein